jgi:acyl carrier protein
MEEKVKQILADLFSIEKNKIHSKFSPLDADDWDSFGHLNVVIALEEEFEITLDEEQISDMKNFELIILILNELLEEKNK